MMLRQRRMALLAGAVVLAGWTGLKAIPSLITGWQEARWDIQDRARTLAQSRRELAGERSLFDSAARVKNAMVGLAPQLLSGETAAQATDALTELLGVAAARSNTKLTASSPVADSAEAGSLRRVAVHAAFDGDIRGVTDMLRSFAEEETVLTTDELRILAAETGGAATSPEVLRVEVTVRGWYQVGRTGGQADRRTRGE